MPESTGWILGPIADEYRLHHRYAGAIDRHPEYAHRDCGYVRPEIPIAIDEPTADPVISHPSSNRDPVSGSSWARAFHRDDCIRFGGDSILEPRIEPSEPILRPCLPVRRDRPRTLIP